MDSQCKSPASHHAIPTPRKMACPPSFGLARRKESELEYSLTKHWTTIDVESFINEQDWHPASKLGSSRLKGCRRRECLNDCRYDYSIVITHTVLILELGLQTFAFNVRGPLALFHSS